MMLFSQRNNLISDDEQLKRFKTRTWNTFNKLMDQYYKCFDLEYDIGVYTINSNIIVAVADKLGIDNTSGNLHSILCELNDYVTTAQSWDRIYSFIKANLEVLFEPLEPPHGAATLPWETTDLTDLQKTAISMYDRILRDENQPYRLYKNQIVPLVSEIEMCEIENASETAYDSVNRHIEKAWAHFADRKNPDYENSIKESISAVEAMCCIITGASGKGAILSVAIKKLKDSGVHIHKAMEEAFSKLYGYTSDESGLRHGSIDFTNVPAEDARYMLVSCSAFVNYLIEKWNKVNTESQG